MNVAVREKHSPATAFLQTLTDLVNADKYSEASAAYQKFEADNSTADFMVLEAVPFKVQNRLIAKTGSPTAFSIYSLRHPTWTTEIVDAFEDPAKFDAFVKGIEAEVGKLAGK